jgi:thiamine-phosphate pyrophosphorylase
MKGLYAIVDTKLLAARGTDPIAYAKAVLVARPAALQLRAKDREARGILALVREIGPLCRHVDVPLVLNDRADLAALAGCDMVHIGQEDLPYALVHRIAPQLGVGVSTHNLEQLERALAFGPRYVAYGPVFAATTSTIHDPAVGLEGLAVASGRAREMGVPLVAIGGITLSDATKVGALADACAVVGDLFPAGATLGSVSERALAFQAALGSSEAPAAVSHP